MAEFVFHRTFDVGQRKISDKIEEKIAGIEGNICSFNTVTFTFCPSVTLQQDMLDIYDHLA